MHSGSNQVQSGAFTCTGGAVSMLSSSHSGMDHDIRVAREPSHLYLMKELIKRDQANSGAIRRNQSQSEWHSGSSRAAQYSAAQAAGAVPGASVKQTRLPSLVGRT